MEKIIITISALMTIAMLGFGCNKAGETKPVEKQKHSADDGEDHTGHNH